MSNLPRDINHWEVKTKPKQLRPSGGPKEWAEHPAKASNTSWLTTVKLQKERIRRLGRDWRDRSTNSRGSHDQRISKSRETPIHGHPGRQDRLIKGRQGIKTNASRVRQDFTWCRAIHRRRIIKRNCIQAEKRLAKRPPHWKWRAQTFNWTDFREKPPKSGGWITTSLATRSTLPP